MIDNAVRTAIHEVLDRMAGASTPGVALDAIPADWPRFVSGPDAHGFHFSMRPAGAPEMVDRMYGRGYGMGRGTTQMEAILEGIAWIRRCVPEPDDILGTLKDRAIALTLAADALNDLYVRLEADSSEEQARVANAEVQRLASAADAAQYAILRHLGRGDPDGWDDSHPLNEAMWTGQATPDQIRHYS